MHAEAPQRGAQAEQVGRQRALFDGLALLRFFFFARQAAGNGRARQGAAVDDFAEATQLAEVQSSDLALSST